MLVDWLLTRIQQSEYGEIEVNFMYESFKFENIESGFKGQEPGLRVFLAYLKSIHPHAKRAQKKVGVPLSSKTVYRGISFRGPSEETKTPIHYDEIGKHLSPNYNVNFSKPDQFECECSSGCLSNGNKITKTVLFKSDHTWSLTIASKVVNLDKFQIDNTFQLTVENIKLITKFVDMIQLCSGVEVSQDIVVSRYHTLEKWQNNNSVSFRAIRSLMCEKVVTLNSLNGTCKTCQKMTFSTSKSKENARELSASSLKEDSSCSTQSKQSVSAESLKDIFPQASEDMLCVLAEQAKNISRHPKGRRWSEKLVTVCLKLFNRSPHSYEILVSSNLLILPSKSLLIKYKNTLKQEAGFDPEVLNWMRLEADRQKLPATERYGGIIFDEMSIQTDLEIDKKGNIIELTGFTDLGKEGDLCHSLKAGKQDKYLGTHVMQMLFLGLNGFRFPFAYFITDNIQASELYGIFWKAVYMLFTYGFKVLYTSMDGAQSNRSFMHIFIGKCSKSFTVLSPCISFKTTFIMDISHVIKKIRNNIIKSGHEKKSTRTLTLPNNCTIQWKMFLDFFMWDRQNGLQIHRKLTNEHFFMDSQMKMRNHLAEEVLNSEMLNAICQYKLSLGEKGNVLNGLIELLTQTSKMIEIFRDMRPIKSLQDQRLQILSDVKTWFTQWKSYIENNSDIPQREKSKKLMSQQCHEDVVSCLQGFIELCQEVLHISSTLYVIPGLINSDVVENIFNQQRSTYHGANSNPSALQYKRSINSIIIGQSLVSKKANAGKSMDAAVPYNFSFKQKLYKRQHKEHDESNCYKKTKLIRL